MVELQGITKTYRRGTMAVEALRGIDLRVPAGDFVAIMGPSGSGKSTLMNIIGCLDQPSSGQYRLVGEEVSALSDNALADVRNQRIGFVFQSFNLLARLSALQNTELPLIYRGTGRPERLQKTLAALTAVGLADRVRHNPMELSGGQQQRVAIARALVGEPALLLADEPTGNLDSRSGNELLALIQALNQKGMTIIIVTHDEQVAAHCKRIILLRDGEKVSDLPVASPLAAGSPLEEVKLA